MQTEPNRETRRKHQAKKRSEKVIWQLLQAVMDPEIPVVSIIEMGIVRAVALEDARVRVTLTPTFSGCPALRVMQDEVKRELEPFFDEVAVDIQLSPPWSSDWLTESAKEKLKAFGIAPPHPTQAGQDTPLITLQEAPTRCPYCASFDTETKNTFGSTLCKAILYCHSCQQPFEGFKTI